jgi:ubiquinone biosynthesis protein
VDDCSALENWNKKRLQPKTIFNALKENVPDWIEQLPHLPQLWLDSMAQQGQQQKQMLQITQELHQLQTQQQQLNKTRSRQKLILGVLALVLALALSNPQFNHWLLSLPVPSLGLGALGVYLLCFRR